MSARKGEIKINENIAVNEPKNITKFNKETLIPPISTKEQIETTITP